MKSIKQLREDYNLITEKEDKEQRKLTALVRAGLFDAKKLPMLKRALEKGVEKMTPAEKRMLIDLLDSLMGQVLSSEPVYMKVKRNVQSKDKEIIAESIRTPVSISDVPSIVVLKRKAVRVYPGGQQVGLYYSQQLDKYVTIPFGAVGISEETALDEAVPLALLPLAGAALRAAAPVVGRGIAGGISKGKKMFDAWKKSKGAGKPTGTTRSGPSVRGRGGAGVPKQRGFGTRRSGPQTRGRGGAGGKLGRVGRLAGAGALAAGILSSLGGSGSSNQNIKKPVTHSRTADPNLVTKLAPQYGTGSDAPVDAATARRLQKQFYAQQNESVSVNLDGNLFEINSNIADKCVDVYNKLNENNKKKMIDMLLNENAQNKIIEFVIRY